MERWKEDFYEKGEICQEDVLLWCIQGKLKLLDVIVIKSHNTCTNQQASSIVFDVCPQVFVQVAPSKIFEKVSYNLRSLGPHSVFNTVLIIVSLKNYNLLQHGLILASLHLDGKKEKKLTIIT